MMFQQQKFFRLPLVGLILSGLFLLAYLASGRRNAKKSRPASSVAQHTVEQSPSDTLKYWTEEKMRTTQANNMPTVNTVEREKQKPQPPSA